MARKVKIVDSPWGEAIDLMQDLALPLASQLCADNQTNWHYKASFTSKEGDRCRITVTVERDE